MKRVVSLVPSWTETLIEAGAAVVGRTRFCIHPKDKVSSIEAIGGTKSFDEEKLRALKPDLIIMDREENTREMFELAKEIAPIHVSHVKHVNEMPTELKGLAQALDASEAHHLESFAKRFEEILRAPTRALHNDSIPATIKIIKGNPSTKDKFVYVIWQNPWMCVSKETFIASMLEQAGFNLENLIPQIKNSNSLSNSDSNSNPNYPVLSSLPTNATILLSSEPFPFAKKTPLLENANVAIIDGESYSWFGIRALRFLESLTKS